MKKFIIITAIISSLATFGIVYAATNIKSVTTTAFYFKDIVPQMNTPVVSFKDTDNNVVCYLLNQENGATMSCVKL